MKSSGPELFTEKSVLLIQSLLVIDLFEFPLSVGVFLGSSRNFCLWGISLFGPGYPTRRHTTARSVPP